MNNSDDLAYLMNPALYDKYKQLSSNEEEIQFIEEKKFYRKRILQMAKDCTRYKIFKDAEIPPKSILKTYNEFIRVCISHFKIEDENEYYQTEYNDVEFKTEKDKSVDPINIQNLDTELLANVPQNKVVTMEDFVTKKSNKINSKIKPPKEKRVNVKDEKYRTKGVKKNKSKDLLDK